MKAIFPLLAVIAPLLGCRPRTAADAISKPDPQMQDLLDNIGRGRFTFLTGEITLADGHAEKIILKSDTSTGRSWYLFVRSNVCAWTPVGDITTNVLAMRAAP